MRTDRPSRSVDADDVTWTILVDDQTVFVVSGQQTIFNADRPDASIQPAGKQGDRRNIGQRGGNSGRDNSGRGNSGRGNSGRGSEAIRALTISDLIVGMQVFVLGETVDDLTVAAARVEIQNAGIVTTSFTVEGRVARFNPFSLELLLESERVLKLTRNTALLGPDGNPAEPRDLLPGARVSASGTIAKKGKRSTHVVETLQILSGRPFELQARVESVDGRVLTLLPRAPEPIDPRAKFADARGRKVSREEFEALLADAQGLDVLFKLNRFGTGIVAMQIYDPNRNREIKDNERLVSASVVTIEPIDAGFLLVFAGRPPVTVADDALIRGDADAATDLSSIVDKRVILAGEVTDGIRVADRVAVIRTLDRIDVQVTVGDFDGQGVENDAEVRVFDPDGGELETSFQLSLDRERPVEAFSGDRKLNLKRGKHKLEVRIPELQGLRGRAEFLIRDRGPNLEVVEVFPADGDVSVAESNEIAISFNAPIEQHGRFVNVTAVLKPDVGRLRDMTLSDDGQTVFIPVKLAAQTTYTLAIASARGTNKQSLRRPVVVTFSTGGEVEAPGEISGSVELAARTKQIEAVEILAGEVIAGDVDRKEAGRGGIETDGPSRFWDWPRALTGCRESGDIDRSGQWLLRWRSGRGTGRCDGCEWRGHQWDCGFRAGAPRVRRAGTQ